MVQQDDAKKMGFGEFAVYKKLRDTLRKPGPKADQVAAMVKDTIKKGIGANSPQGYK